MPGDRPLLEAVSRPEIGDLVARKLTASIASQGLKPGDRLTNENELAASFGAGRLSLREATKALESLLKESWGKLPACQMSGLGKQGN